MTYSVIHVGIGNQGINWCEHYLPRNVEKGLIDVVAAVDIDEDALERAKPHLDLSDEQCYTDLERAFEEHSVDICTVATPPSVHEAAVDVALEHDAHVLCEKPIADTLEASVRIAEKVEWSGKKMGVTMSHRFDRDKTTLRRELRSGDHGRLDYLVLRFTCNCRSFGSWGGEWKYEMDDPLLVSGGIHHLDILADLAESRCETVYANTWNPPWGDFAGNAQALLNLMFENGVKATYEGAKTNAACVNGWGHEYIRAESEDATLVLDERELVRYPYDPDEEPQAARGVDPDDGHRIPLHERETWTNAWLVEQFVDWIDGGERMATNVRDNLYSTATVFAAIESDRRGEPVDVQEFLRDARTRAAD
ncbi:Gfo/Idh/MocA family oxidoreductase [Halobacteria archaeon AArc-m2/3/4]|uniref:Gfo/Idh/MocA family oxidoreductase n=1 Tax=Natronoglomus mannanivorans TaxID=2979990 RepID=A0ABT2QKS6_9EURY|nr:Gfo/Idh/MocA family oxidoreductase [Halobacteria archaeon AArc-m2/3/4]